MVLRSLALCCSSSTSPLYSRFSFRGLTKLPLLALRYPRSSDHHGLYHSFPITWTDGWRQFIWCRVGRNWLLPESGVLFRIPHARRLIVYLTCEVLEGETDIGEIVALLYSFLWLYIGCIDLALSYYILLASFTMVELAPPSPSKRVKEWIREDKNDIDIAFATTSNERKRYRKLQQVCLCSPPGFHLRLAQVPSFSSVVRIPRD